MSIIQLLALRGRTFAGTLVALSGVLATFSVWAENYVPASRCEAVGNAANFRVAPGGSVYNPSRTTTATVSCPTTVFDGYLYVNAMAYLLQKTTTQTACYLVQQNQSGTAGMTYPRTVSGTGAKVLKWNHVPLKYPLQSIRCNLQRAGTASSTNALQGVWYNYPLN